MVDTEMLHVSSEKNGTQYRPLAIGFITASYSPGTDMISFDLLGPTSHPTIGLQQKVPELLT